MGSNPTSGSSSIPRRWPDLILRAQRTSGRRPQPARGGTIGEAPPVGEMWIQVPASERLGTGMWRSLEAHRSGGPEAVGSSPTIPTQNGPIASIGP